MRGEFVDYEALAEQIMREELAELEADEAKV